MLREGAISYRLSVRIRVALRKEAQEVLAPPAVLQEIAGQDDEAKRQIDLAQWRSAWHLAS